MLHFGGVPALFAPRQMGKTTLLRKLNEMLADEPNYLSIPISFERYEFWPESKFLNYFAKVINHHLREAF